MNNKPLCSKTGHLRSGHRTFYYISTLYSLLLIMLLFLTPRTAEEIKPLTKYSSIINTGQGLAGSEGCAVLVKYFLEDLRYQNLANKNDRPRRAWENNCLRIRTLKTDDEIWPVLGPCHLIAEHGQCVLWWGRGGGGAAARYQEMCQNMSDLSGQIWPHPAVIKIISFIFFPLLRDCLTL